MADTVSKLYQTCLRHSIGIFLCIKLYKVLENVVDDEFRIDYVT